MPAVPHVSGVLLHGVPDGRGRADHGLDVATSEQATGRWCLGVAEEAQSQLQFTYVDAGVLGLVNVRVDAEPILVPPVEIGTARTESAAGSGILGPFPNPTDSVRK